MSEKIDPDEVEQWLQHLLSGSGEQARLQAASALSRLRMKGRGTTRTRGSLRRAALAEFPASRPDATAEILAMLQHEQSAAVRREIAAVLGEWGGSEAVSLLGQLIEQDAAEGVRRACVRAVGLIGGPQAEQILRQTASGDHQPEAVQREAIAALIALAQKETQSRSGRLRTRGGSAPASDVVVTLQQISANKRLKGYLRHMAESGWQTLTDEPE